MSVLLVGKISRGATWKASDGHEERAAVVNTFQKVVKRRLLWVLASAKGVRCKIRHAHEERAIVVHSLHEVEKRFSRLPHFAEMEITATQGRYLQELCPQDQGIRFSP